MNREFGLIQVFQLQQTAVRRFLPRHDNIVLDLMLVCFLTFLRCFSLRRSSVAVLVFLTMLLMLPLVGLLRAAPPDDAEDSVDGGYYLR